MSAGSSRLEIRLLGPVDVSVDGLPLAVDTKKAVALLAYLAVSGQEHSRDHLADLLWPNADPERARATLRRTLSALRSGLSDRWIEADRSNLRFRPDDNTWIDVGDLADAVVVAHDHGSDEVCPRCVDTLSPVAALVRGEFMQGFALRGCPSFDDWMLAEAERQRRRVSSLFERLSAALATHGRYAEAIDVAARWLDFDPLLEKAHRATMLFRAWSGDRSGAVDAYRRLVSVLESELGVEPLEETTELYEGILEEDVPRAPAPARRIQSITPSVRPEYPFVGRSEPLDRLRSVVNRGHGIAIVEGELGVGKTRLVEELLRELRPSKTRVLLAQAHRSETTVAYAPIQTVLEGMFEPAGPTGELAPSVTREVARLVPSLGEPGPADPSDIAARVRFLDAVSQVIGAGVERVVLCVDDLQWLDAASLELIGYMARRLDRLGVVLILTRRPEESPIDHPVSILVEDLAGDAVVLRLGRLDASAVGDLVDASGVPGIDPDAVYERTRGLPFFIVEYLDAARAGHTELPAAVRRLVMSRLADIDAIGRQLITAAAVIGPVVDVDALRSVSGRSEEEILAGVDDLIGRAILREREEGALEFVHEQLREVAYEEASQIRKRLLHKRAAEHLESRAGTAADGKSVAGAARHHQAAGNLTEAARLSMSAGRLAAEVFAFGEAIGHYERALALGHPDRGVIHRQIGDLRTLVGEYGAALSAYEMARIELSSQGVVLEVAQVARAIGEVYRRLRRWDMAAASFREAFTGAEYENGLAASVAADWAFVEFRRGRASAGRELIEVALERSEASADAAVLAHVHNLAGLLASHPDDTVEHLERALSHAVEASAQAAVLNNLARVLADSGDFEGAVAHGRQAVEVAQRAGDRHRTAALHDNLAGYLHRLGNEEASIEELKQAVTLFSEVGLERGELQPDVWFLDEW